MAKRLPHDNMRCLIAQFRDVRRRAEGHTAAVSRHVGRRFANSKVSENMGQFKNIVLVYECDETTLQHAARLAKDSRARLTVVQVIREKHSSRSILP
jgi:hypothetical protein